jgi:hypothetical protein
MPSEFIALLDKLIQNSATPLPRDGASPTTEPDFPIQKFRFQPYIFVNRTNFVSYKGTGVKSKIGSVLKPVVTNPADFDLAFTEIVDLSLARTHLVNYAVMGFLNQANKLLTPQDVVRLAEIHGGGARGNRGGLGGGGGNLSPTPNNLKNGLWHHVASGAEFFINDSLYRSGGDPNAGAGTTADAPILALGNNLHRVLSVSPGTDTWYEDLPPPAAPRNTDMYPAYVRALRSYLKKMAIQMIEQDHWFLLWHGYLYTDGRSINFKDIMRRSAVLRRQNINWPLDVTITEMDANNASFPLNTFKWGELQATEDSRSIGSGGGGGAYTSFYEYFTDIGRALNKRYQRIIIPESRDPDLTGDLLHALVEGRLDESLTYNQMLTATASYWQTRLKTVRNVHTSPPGLVMLKDGTVDLSFDFVSRPSTEGRPHQGYVKFVPERGQPKLIDKLKDFLGRIGQQVKRFIGKKVPPRALKGSDLRKMLCEVSCDCKDFKYRMSYANVKQGVTTQAGRTDNGRAPVKTNPARRPGFCKHILATLRYLTDDAEIQISKDLSREQQEALKKDRAQFYKEAEISYEKMEAPAAKGAEEIEPEEEPASPEFAKLPAPPKPELAPRPLVPPVAAPPPTPNYQSTQT